LKILFKTSGAFFRQLDDQIRGGASLRRRGSGRTVEEEVMPAIPEIIVTGASDGDLHFEANAEEEEEDLNEIY